MTDDEPEPRLTTVHYRYQISDPLCGLIECASKSFEAFQIARRHECDEVSVFDSMAHIGAPDEWSRAGAILGRNTGARS